MSQPFKPDEYHAEYQLESIELAPLKVYTLNQES